MKLPLSFEPLILLSNDYMELQEYYVGDRPQFHLLIGAVAKAYFLTGKISREGLYLIIKKMGLKNI
ncbi:hypothetical protein D7X25_23910 [bacterium 1XD42-8]|nr:hypothetical protein D7X25_23910 [bacterium 1XD42-8]